ncbi:universal stress protein [Flavobacterium sp. ZB4R12]|uniref:universal stress protein n=1 Tax=Flavobacterium sp. ZB4R12 TaxID=3398732 RepID=UPI003AAF90E5
MKTILIPTDFSSNANNALKYANAFAQATNNKIVLLHTYIPILGNYNRIPGIIAEENARVKKESQKNLEDLCNKYVEVSCHNLVTIGDPIDTILDVSRKAKVDLIIMGTHGASGLRQILFGSNTSGVISKSTVPVLAIPQRYRFRKIDTIVYASDLKNTFNELKHIIPIAKQLDATIEILNLNYGYNSTDDEKKTIEKKIKSLSYKKIKFIEQKATLEQTMAEQLKKYLVKHKPQILVMFPDEKSWFDKIFISSKTEEMANQLKLPLLSIKKIIVKQN